MHHLGLRCQDVMAQLEIQFWQLPGSRWSPLIWMVRGYHFLYCVVLFAHMRQQEFAADRFEVKHVGKDQAGATTILLDVLHHLPWARLDAVAEDCVATNQPEDQIFAEQVRRARRADRSEWEDACRKALKERTKLFDTHPCLKERLKAIGVSPKKALRLAMDQSGEPATALFTNWKVVEKFLTDRVMDIVRENYLADQEYAEIVQAIVRGGPPR